MSSRAARLLEEAGLTLDRLAVAAGRHRNEVAAELAGTRAVSDRVRVALESLCGPDLAEEIAAAAARTRLALLDEKQRGRL